MHSWTIRKVEVILFYSVNDRKASPSDECWHSESTIPHVMLAAVSLPWGGSSRYSSLNSASCTKCWLTHTWNGFSLWRFCLRECHHHPDNYLTQSVCRWVPDLIFYLWTFLFPYLHWTYWLIWPRATPKLTVLK